jgi:hypothetical protein
VAPVAGGSLSDQLEKLARYVVSINK